MPNHMKKCGRKMCRIGMHRRYKWLVRLAVRRFRQVAKRLLKNGEQPDDKFGVPYTD